ncbi:ABC-three component system protein [Rhodopirellula bahusiensis]|uniref:ABC-three component system protein n=1 Tax=Rhodopirellula bahusiensis TaxID=2014065 RepID=UPI003267B9CE
MDRYQRNYLRLMARDDYREKKRQVFQDWVGQLLKKALKGDYENIRLTQGDGGLDGIILSESAVVAVFAPRRATQSELEKKIASDFAAAEQTLKERKVVLKKLVFVHNDEGLTKGVGTLMMQLQQDKPGVKIEIWTFENLWTLMQSLSEDEIQDLLGLAPTSQMLEKLEMPSIREVIEHLVSVQAEPPAVGELTIPDPDKLQYNDLSETCRDLLRVGRSKHALVARYLEGMTDLRTGEAIAEGFRRKYASCRAGGMQPDDTFETLWHFAGGDHFTTPFQHAAVTAVLSHFFHTCDIFENARDSS